MVPAPGKSAKQQVLDALEKVGMTAYRHHPFAELSGGERQRILIARALATEPTLLVLDEPTAGIDLMAEESILKLLAELNKENRLTILMVSHQWQVLQKYVQRVIVVRDQGSPPVRSMRC